jgi:hypothetical protein
MKMKTLEFVGLSKGHAKGKVYKVDIKDSVKEDTRFFALGLLLWGFCFEVFAFGFWLSDVGGFWKGK